QDSVDRIMIFFFQAEDGIRDRNVTGVQTCALPISVADSAETSIGRFELKIVGPVASAAWARSSSPVTITPTRAAAITSTSSIPSMMSVPTPADVSRAPAATTKIGRAHV